MELLEIKFDNTLREYCLPLGEIRDDGVAAIKGAMESWGYFFTWPEWWQWRNIVSGKGDYVGSFVKRIRKYLRKEKNKEFTHAGELGSLIGQYSSWHNCYNFRFSADEWNEGDFGDDGSCFFGCRAKAPARIFDSVGGAVQFFDAEHKGFARCWIKPIGEQLVLFNAYGLELLTIARIVSGYLGLSYRRVRICNNDETQGLIWINGNGGFVIAQDVSVYSEDGESRIDLRIETGPQCCNCEAYLDEGDEICEGDSVYCEDCHSELFTTCDDCEDIYSRADLNNITLDDGEDRSVCNSCRDDYHECQCCNRYIHIG